MRKLRERDDAPPPHAYAAHTRRMSSVRPAKDLGQLDMHRQTCGYEKRTDIVRVELINAHAHGERRHAQRPGQDWSERGELAFMDVIHQDGIKLGIMIRN